MDVEQLERVVSVELLNICNRFHLEAQDMVCRMGPAKLHLHQRNAIWILRISTAELTSFRSALFFFFPFWGYVPFSDPHIFFVKIFNNISHFLSVFTEKYCTANHVDKLPGPRDWVQILQDQIKLARRRLKRGSGMNQLQEKHCRSALSNV